LTDSSCSVAYVKPFKFGNSFQWTDESVKEKYRKEVENIVTNYIKSHIRGNTRLKEHNIYEDSGWEIKEWSSNDKKYFPNINSQDTKYVFIFSIL
ncbi:hypothetical protein, partial [Mycoplasmopsis bovis]|uniref:hypothetical protein n=1 Tax=Mycoplasmopsis bovis TaxID=28903 RepID=UPI003D298268